MTSASVNPNRDLSCAIRFDSQDKRQSGCLLLFRTWWQWVLRRKNLLKNNVLSVLAVPEMPEKWAEGCQLSVRSLSSRLEAVKNGGVVMRKVFRGLLCLFALCTTNLFGQESVHAPKIVHTPEKSQVHVPATIDSGLVKIFSNLGSPRRAYNDTFGFLVAGPASGTGQEFAALAFTPKSDSTITTIEAALAYIFQGNGSPRQIDLSVYTDEGGTPGTLIAGPHTVKNLPDPGTCCKVATWHVKPGLSIFAGVQYWVVADAPASGKGNDSAALWEITYPTYPQAFDDGTAWFSVNGNSRLAGAVLGTVP
jgi:hypothetical protein